MHGIDWDMVTTGAAVIIMVYTTYDILPTLITNRKNLFCARLRMYALAAISLLLGYSVSGSGLVIFVVGVIICALIWLAAPLLPDIDQES
ncbi:hypothetical protein HY491_02265 [Candidatus Woesearchaeota archaeon]|nr:hypothetical protein [Candidatus Woesearchaeota archaeon]